MLPKQEKRQRRHLRIRAKIKGTAEVPRLCVFRSNRHIYAQLIDDEKGKTMLAVSDLNLKKELSSKKEEKGRKGGEMGLTKTALAHEVGLLLSKKAKEKNISKVCFDRGGYKYHGRVKALAEGAREGGLKF